MPAQDQADAWGDFLKARTRLIHAWLADGQTAEQVARALSCDADQVAAIQAATLCEALGLQHSSPRRELSAPAEAWLLWDMAASQGQRSFADWARGVLTAAADEALNLDPAALEEGIGE